MQSSVKSRFCVVGRQMLDTELPRLNLPCHSGANVRTVLCRVQHATTAILYLVTYYVRSTYVIRSTTRSPAKMEPSQRDSTTLASVLRGAETGKGGLELVGVPWGELTSSAEQN